MNIETRDERLRRLLREADPASAGSGLTTEEAREMRRAVLTAAPEPRRRLALLRALAGAAMAALAAIAVLALWPRPESTTPPPRPDMNRTALQRTDVKATDVKGTDERTNVKVRPADELPDANRTASVAAGLRARRPAAPAPREQLAAAGGAAPDSEDEPRTRQIQFDTPGGTRVIWILTANNAL